MKLKDFIKNIILDIQGAGCSGIIDLDIGVSYTDENVLFVDDASQNRIRMKLEV